MGKNRRKRPRPASATEPSAVSVPGGWKSVSVQLSHEEGVSSKIVVDNDGGHDHVEDRDMTGDVEEYTGNHYDDPKLSRKAEKDLPMNRGEDCAMFCSLEVLDASQYRVETKGAFKRLIINGGGEVEETAKAAASALPDDKAKAKPQTEKANPGDDKPSETKGSSISEPKKKKRKKKKKKDKTTTTKDGEDPDQDKKALPKEKKEKKASQERKPIPAIELEPISPDDIMKLQLSWSSSSGGAHLHNILIESLHRLGFDSPTPIQAATLAASTMGRRNLVGAAPTGSGKTLAFLLPILNSILMEKNEVEDEPLQDDDDNNALPSNKLQALIMTPTRGKCFFVCFVYEMCLLVLVKYYIDDDDNIMLTLLEYHKFEGRSLKR